MRLGPKTNKFVAVLAGISVALAGFYLLTTNAAQNPAADINDDNQVNIFDLSILLSKWGQTGAGNIADINTDNVVSIFDLSILLASWGPISGAPSGDLAMPRIPWEGGPSYYAQFPKANQSGWDDATFFPISVFLGNTDPSVLDEYKDAGVNTLLAVQSQSPISTVTGKGLFAIPHLEPEDRSADWTSAQVGNDPGVVGWFATDECEMGYSGCLDHNLTSAQCDTAFNTNDTDKTKLYIDRTECKSVAAKNLAECTPLDSLKYQDNGECLEYVYQKHLADFIRAKNDGRFVAANFGNGIARTFWSPKALDAHYNYMDFTAVDKYAYTSKGAAGVLTGDPLYNFGSYDWPDGGIGNRAAAYGFMADQFKRVQNPASLRPIGVMVETGQPLIDDNDCWMVGCNIQPDQIEGAAWSAIIHEARHLSYFDFNNGPTCGSMVNCPVVHAKVKAINGKIKSLAPVLNTQSYYNHSYANNGTTFYRYTFNNGTDTMLKTYNGSAYIFAGLGMDITGQHSGNDWCGTVDGKNACKNIGGNHTTGSKTFTLPAGVNGTSVEVVGENRTLTVNASRQFTDSFANEYTHHVYKISLNAGTSSCALPNFPDETCTGVPAGTTLTNYTGPASPAAGTVIDGKNISQCMSLNQPGIIIKNSRLNVHCSYVVDAWITSTNQADWAQIINSEIICPNGGSAGIGERGIIVRGVEISGCENGMDLDQDALIEDNYIHTLDEGPAGEGHGDGIQSAILQNITIRHNTIIGRSGDLYNPGNNATSAIITPPNGTSNTLIEYNYLAGGAATLYCPENSPVNVRVLNNTFAVRPGPLGAAFFYMDGCDSGTIVSGNVTDTGQPVNP